MTMIVKCPTCRDETAWQDNPYRPFCSERCQLIDLGAWIEGKHRVPGERVDLDRESENDEDDKRNR